MSKWKVIKARWTNWEFWPFWFLYLPIFAYYVWLALRERSFFFFTSSNPTIEFGGMLGERKSDIFRLIPGPYCPKTVLVTEERVKLLEMAMEIGFPLIAKPDIGQRGEGVELINSTRELEKYSEDMPVDFLLQEFVDYPVEVGIFYIRNPYEHKGKISSVVIKEFLTVIGDGIGTIRELLERKERAMIQLDWEHPRFSHLLGIIPDVAQQVIVEPIGNHCRGTTFLNGNDVVDKHLEDAIDRLAKEIPEFYFGRFDLKCKSLDDLRELKNFKILELNGAGAEPGHVYQPGYSLTQAYRELCWHLKQLAIISRANQARGHSYSSFRQGIKKLLDIRAYNRRLSSR